MTSPELQARNARYVAFERRVGPLMLALSILFVPVFLFSLVSSLPAQWRLWLEWVSWGIWACFALEFVVRFALAPRKRHMLRAHAFDLIVLVLPFLRVFRAARALRSLGRAVFAVGGMTLSGRALDNTRRMARTKGVPYVIALVVMATFAGALIVMQVESVSASRNIEGFGDAVWWAVSTVTTVGYGDRYPTTTEGRVVAFALMLLGLGLFSLVTARIAAFFLGDEQQDAELHAKLDELNARLARLEAALDARPGPPGIPPKG